ncbi:hypothetical protein [Brevibacterium sp. UCMA 11754]|uniref:hypothetical protein n=1 Tax=Brevibacterium sp. UCMA 11754 TaxID=2749198 RepID=UPI001F475C63|nr:hypothetical protein [Brevibacterium sp. UCMA 11754]MCF2573089.1 hypothetical protein [Brevibacterium sp. UCMA 11754]
MSRRELPLPNEQIGMTPTDFRPHHLNTFVDRTRDLQLPEEGCGDVREDFTVQIATSYLLQAVDSVGSCPDENLQPFEYVTEVVLQLKQVRIILVY